MTFTAKEAKQLYKDKLFYEIVRDKEDPTHFHLYGPLDTIRYVVPTEGKIKDAKYRFAQIINGKPVQFFTKEEILITKKAL